MNIGAKKVVSIDYTLRGDDGHVIDSSRGRKPLTYLHGAGNLVSGLEKALEGKRMGEAVDVVVSPDEGYGARDEKLVTKMPVRKLPEKKAEVGMRYRVRTDDGAQYLLVTAVSGDYATVDGNHPLAGVTLRFSVKIMEVRDATPDELTHGHVHGAGGHHH
jgi:FKBP-type peptidyl-prolyl cis-trans isomerase SlyD